MSEFQEIATKARKAEKAFPSAYPLASIVAELAELCEAQRVEIEALKKTIADKQPAG